MTFKLLLRLPNTTSQIVWGWPKWDWPLSGVVSMVSQNKHRQSPTCSTLQMFQNMQDLSNLYRLERRGRWEEGESPEGPQKLLNQWYFKLAASESTQWWWLWRWRTMTQWWWDFLLFFFIFTQFYSSLFHSLLWRMTEGGLGAYGPERLCCGIVYHMGVYCALSGK